MNWKFWTWARQIRELKAKLRVAEEQAVWLRKEVGDCNRDYIELSQSLANLQAAHDQVKARGYHL